MQARDCVRGEELPADRDTRSQAGRIVDDRLKSSRQPTASGTQKTLNALLDNCCEKFYEFSAIGMAFEQPLHYFELHRKTLVLAAQLQKDGIKHGCRIAILAENSYHWGIVYLASVRLGAVAVPVLPDLPEADVHHILGEMECEIIFVTQRHLDKIYDLSAKPTRIITLDDSREKGEFVALERFSDYIQKAEDSFALSLQNGETRFPEVHEDDPASILYTSGTSGFSKAVVLSHANLYSNVHSADKIIHIEPGSIFLSVLPLSHAYEFTVGFLLPLIKGCRIIYTGKAPTPVILQKICRLERPHATLVVPLIMEKIYKKRVVPILTQNRAFKLTCRFGWGRRMINRRIGKKLLDFFGNRLTVMGIGGAPLNPEVEAFLVDSGFPYLVGYGMTEAAPLLSGGPQGDPSISPGSAGKPVPEVEIRIDQPDPISGIGEIQAKGPNIMQEYWNDPEATNEVFTEDGWLRTGDLGLFDRLGNLHIKGRTKSVIVLANGENIYPEPIEHKLNTYPFIVESLVLEKNGMIEGWVYLDYEYIDSVTQDQSRQQRHHYITTLLDRIRLEINAQLAPSSRVIRIVERREPFVKTATQKIKRYLYSSDTIN